MFVHVAGEACAKSGASTTAAAQGGGCRMSHMSSSCYFKNNGPGLSWPWPMSCLHQEDENRFLNLKGDALSILSPTGSCGHL